LSPHFNVWTTKKRVEKLRYTHRNPVKCGLVNLPEQWRWSSYRFYFLDEAGLVWINEGWGKIFFKLLSRDPKTGADVHGSRPSQSTRRTGHPLL
jgi:hypothetical protein